MSLLSLNTNAISRYQANVIDALTRSNILLEQTNETISYKRCTEQLYAQTDNNSLYVNDWAPSCNVYCRKFLAEYGYLPRSCLNACRTSAGSGSGPLDLTNIPADLSTNCEIDAACLVPEFYADNPRVCYRRCNDLEHPTAPCAAVSAAKCFDGTFNITRASCSQACQNSMNNGINPSGVNRCNLGMVCRDPAMFLDPIARPTCLNYCLNDPTRAAECGMPTKCGDNGNYDDPTCIAYCGSSNLGFPCDGVLATYCSDPNNLNKPVCQQYCMRHPTSCSTAVMNYCSNNITDPRCRDFCAMQWTTTADGITTLASNSQQCDSVARTYCEAFRQRLLLKGQTYPMDYNAMSAEDKRDADFCSCFLSPLGEYGQAACIDTKCQASGYQSLGMRQIVENRGCSTCTQIVSGNGSFWSINGVNQQMTCGTGGDTVFRPVPINDFYTAQLFILWRNPSDGSGQITMSIPLSIANRFDALIRITKCNSSTVMQALTETERVNDLIMIFNAIGAVNPIVFTDSDANIMVEYAKVNFIYFYTYLKIKNNESNSVIDIYNTGNNLFTDVGKTVARLVKAKILNIILIEQQIVNTPPPAMPTTPTVLTETQQAAVLLNTQFANKALLLTAFNDQKDASIQTINDALTAVIDAIRPTWTATIDTIATTKINELNSTITAGYDTVLIPFRDILATMTTYTNDTHTVVINARGILETNNVPTKISTYGHDIVYSAVVSAGTNTAREVQTSQTANITAVVNNLTTVLTTQLQQVAAIFTNIYESKKDGIATSMYSEVLAIKTNIINNITSTTTATKNAYNTIGFTGNTTPLIVLFTNITTPLLTNYGNIRNTIKAAGYNEMIRRCNLAINAAKAALAAQIANDSSTTAMLAVVETTRLNIVAMTTAKVDELTASLQSNDTNSRSLVDNAITTSRNQTFTSDITADNLVIRGLNSMTTAQIVSNRDIAATNVINSVNSFMNNLSNQYNTILTQITATNLANITQLLNATASSAIAAFSSSLSAVTIAANAQLGTRDDLKTTVSSIVSTQIASLQSTATSLVTQTLSSYNNAVTASMATETSNVTTVISNVTTDAIGKTATAITSLINSIPAAAPVLTAEQQNANKLLIIAAFNNQKDVSIRTINDAFTAVIDGMRPEWASAVDATCAFRLNQMTTQITANYETVTRPFTSVLATLTSYADTTPLVPISTTVSRNIRDHTYDNVFRPANGSGTNTNNDISSNQAQKITAIMISLTSVLTTQLQQVNAVYNNIYDSKKDGIAESMQTEVLAAKADIINSITNIVTATKNAYNVVDTTTSKSPLMVILFSISEPIRTNYNTRRATLRTASDVEMRRRVNLAIAAAKAELAAQIANDPVTIAMLAVVETTRANMVTMTTAKVAELTTSLDTNSIDSKASVDSAVTTSRNQTFTNDITPDSLVARGISSMTTAQIVSNRDNATTNVINSINTFMTNLSNQYRTILTQITADKLATTTQLLNTTSSAAIEDFTSSLSAASIAANTQLGTRDDLKTTIANVVTAQIASIRSTATSLVSQKLSSYNNAVTTSMTTETNAVATIISTTTTEAIGRTAAAISLIITNATPSTTTTTTSPPTTTNVNNATDTSTTINNTATTNDLLAQQQAAAAAALLLRQTASKNTLLSTFTTQQTTSINSINTALTATMNNARPIWTSSVNTFSTTRLNQLNSSISANYETVLEPFRSVLASMTSFDDTRTVLIDDVPTTMNSYGRLLISNATTVAANNLNNDIISNKTAQSTVVSNNLATTLAAQLQQVNATYTNLYNTNQINVAESMYSELLAAKATSIGIITTAANNAINNIVNVISPATVSQLISIFNDLTTPILSTYNNNMSVIANDGLVEMARRATSAIDNAKQVVAAQVANDQVALNMLAIVKNAQTAITNLSNDKLTILSSVIRSIERNANQSILEEIRNVESNFFNIDSHPDNVLIRLVSNTSIDLIMNDKVRASQNIIHDGDVFYENLFGQYNIRLSQLVNNQFTNIKQSFNTVYTNVNTDFTSSLPLIVDNVNSSLGSRDDLKTTFSNFITSQIASFDNSSSIQVEQIITTYIHNIDIIMSGIVTQLNNIKSEANNIITFNVNKAIDKVISDQPHQDQLPLDPPSGTTNTSTTGNTNNTGTSTTGANTTNNTGTSTGNTDTSTGNTDTSTGTSTGNTGTSTSNTGSSLVDIQNRLNNAQAAINVIINDTFATDSILVEQIRNNNINNAKLDELITNLDIMLEPVFTNVHTNITTMLTKEFQLTLKTEVINLCEDIYTGIQRSQSNEHDVSNYLLKFIIYIAGKLASKGYNDSDILSILHDPHLVELYNVSFMNNKYGVPLSVGGLKSYDLIVQKIFMEKYINMLISNKFIDTILDDDHIHIITEVLNYISEFLLTKNKHVTSVDIESVITLAKRNYSQFIERMNTNIETHEESTLLLYPMDNVYKIITNALNDKITILDALLLSATNNSYNELQLDPTSFLAKHNDELNTPLNNDSSIVLINKINNDIDKSIADSNTLFMSDITDRFIKPYLNSVNNIMLESINFGIHDLKIGYNHLSSMKIITISERDKFFETQLNNYYVRDINNAKELLVNFDDKLKTSYNNMCDNINAASLSYKFRVMSAVINTINVRNNLSINTNDTISALSAPTPTTCVNVTMTKDTLAEIDAQYVVNKAALSPTPDEHVANEVVPPAESSSSGSSSSSIASKWWFWLIIIFAIVLIALGTYYLVNKSKLGKPISDGINDLPERLEP